MPAVSSETTQKAHYTPPWADMKIIGIAGSSGSGKSSLAVEIVKSLSLPWVIILAMVQAKKKTNIICRSLARGVTSLQDSFYKSLTPEQNALAHANEYDLDSPSSIDFDLLVEKLRDLKQG